MSKNSVNKVIRKAISAAEIAVVIGVVLAMLFVDEYPTYQTAIISFEHWPVVFLGSILVMVLMGLLQYKMNRNHRIHARYNNNALAFVAGACAMALGKALIDDIGDAFVMYEDVHTSTTASGWVALFVMAMVVCVYGVRIYFLANGISDKHRNKLKQLAA